MALPSTRPMEALQLAKAVTKSTPSKKPPVYTMPKMQAAMSTSTGAMRSTTWPRVSLPSSASSP